MIRIVPYWAVAFLLAIVLSGCASTKPVPVAMQRQLPRVPAECDAAKDPKFPRVRAPRGGVVSPEQSARWGIEARQWSEKIRARRQVCAAYGRKMKKWK